ncbi:MAG: hypothetical protein MUC88_20500, partial [Planctomycetes bacterium]|nr:hypothetical protein [Planctomycetota bacterium]
LGLVTAASSVLSGGGPLGGVTGDEGGPVTSSASSGGTQTASTGSFTVGGSSALPLVGLGVLIGLALAEFWKGR